VLPKSDTRDGVPLSNLGSSADDYDPKIIKVNTIVNEVSPPNKLAIRCRDGFKTLGPTKIYIKPKDPANDLSAMWSLALDTGGVAGTFMNWGDPLTITKMIKDVNTIFWLRARGFAAEVIGFDDTCYLEVETSITSY